MIVLDVQSKCGYPLQYYNTFTELFPNFNLNYRYSNRTNSNNSCSSDSNSDSDNSLSSSENNIIKNSLVNWSGATGSISKRSEDDVKCCWSTCGLWFPNLDKLARHVTTEHAISGAGGLFYCQWMGCARNLRGFNARYKMLVHVRTHTNEKPHLCTECDKAFSRAENLKIHFRSHSGEKPYVCPVPGCQKAYSNSSDRFKHTRTHQVDKPYMCKVPGCSKRYTDPSSLRKHVKSNKHFVVVAPKSNSPTPDEMDCDRQSVEELQSSPKSKSRFSDEIHKTLPNAYNDKFCECKHTCHLKQVAPDAVLFPPKDIFTLHSQFLDSKSQFDTSDIKSLAVPIASNSWNRQLWNPFFNSSLDSRKINIEQIQTELPLDLRTHRS